MKYVGSKNKYAKELLSIILKDRLPYQFYVEPFVGGCNIIDKVGGNRIGNDIHYYLIELLKSIQDGWIPPNYISEEEYKIIKNNIDKYSPCLAGFVGFCCSYSGKWWGGYARGSDKYGNPRNYAAEAKRNLIKQALKLKEIILLNKNYYEFFIPSNSIIYCDPPHQKTTKYKGCENFDYNRFWNWVRKRTFEGHKVFVSEYNAPKDFVCIWRKEVNNTLEKNTGSKKGIEKLWKKVIL